MSFEKVRDAFMEGAAEIEKLRKSLAYYQAETNRLNNVIAERDIQILNLAKHLTGAVEISAEELREIVEDPDTVIRRIWSNKARI